ncbi:MAG: hypothetical protein OXH84_07430 [Gammaproteobacteria bacterium]|nr:hypothetical protein [Gammaproteobacteria bacterium]
MTDETEQKSTVDSTNSTAEAAREQKRSDVRIRITYGAAIFLFLFCPVVAIILACVNQWALAEKVVFAIIPVSGSIIAYWFGGRNNKKR